MLSSVFVVWRCLCRMFKRLWLIYVVLVCSWFLG